jgi:hypothetical protein
MAKPTGNKYLKAAHAMAKTSQAPLRNRTVKMATPYTHTYPDTLPQVDYSFATRVTFQSPKEELRGEHHAMFLAAAYHNVELHQRLRPLNASAAKAFDALERIRLEYLGLTYEQERFPTLLDELDSAFEARHNSYGWFVRTLSPAVAAEQFARSVILKGRPHYTPSTGWFDRWLWKHREEAFGRRFNRLTFTLMDQSAFAGTALRVLEESGFRISHKERGEAEEELQLAMGRNPSIQENLQRTERQETEEDKAREEKLKMEKGSKWIGRILGILDSITYKIHNQISGFTDFLDQILHKVGKERQSTLSQKVLKSVGLFILLPSALFALILDPLAFLSSIATGLVGLGTYVFLSHMLSPEFRRRRQLLIRRLKNRYLPPILRPGLWRAQQMMQQLALNQFNHMADPLARQIGNQRSVESSYACYQRQEDGWVSLHSLPTHTAPNQSDFLKAVSQVCARYKRELKELPPSVAASKDSGNTYPVFDQPDGEILDTNRLAGQIINPSQEPAYSGTRTEIKKKNRYTITLALSPSLFHMRAMPEIYALCTALDKKGFDTEVLALFCEAKKPFTSGYGRAQPLKSVYIKKAATPIQRSVSSFTYAHNVAMPQDHVFGEGALFAMNHARTRFGEKALGLYIGDDSWNSKHRTFRGRIRKVQKVLEVFDFDAYVCTTMNGLVREKRSYLDAIVFKRHPNNSPHLLSHALAASLKALMDKHPSCG